MSTTSPDRTDADTAGREAPHRRKFPWWVLLLLALAVIALLAFALTRGGGIDDGTATSEDQAAEDADGSAGGDAGEADTEDGADADDGSDGQGSGAKGSNPDVVPGKITAGGATVYPLSSNLTVGDYDGQDVVGKGVRVESVVADEGFWVGKNANDRIFVLLTNTGPESAPAVTAGDMIDFEGVVVAHGPEFAEQVGVDRNEGAQRLAALAGHVEVPEYRLSDT